MDAASYIRARSTRGAEDRIAQCEAGLREAREAHVVSKEAAEAEIRNIPVAPLCEQFVDRFMDSANASLLDEHRRNAASIWFPVFGPVERLMKTHHTDWKLDWGALWLATIPAYILLVGPIFSNTWSIFGYLLATMTTFCWLIYGQQFTPLEVPDFDRPRGGARTKTDFPRMPQLYGKVRSLYIRNVLPRKALTYIGILLLFLDAYYKVPVPAPIAVLLMIAVGVLEKVLHYTPTLPKAPAFAAEWQTTWHETGDGPLVRVGLEALNNTELQRFADEHGVVNLSDLKRRSLEVHASSIALWKPDADYQNLLLSPFSPVRIPPTLHGFVPTWRSSSRPEETLVYSVLNVLPVVKKIETAARAYAWRIYFERIIAAENRRRADSESTATAMAGVYLPEKVLSEFFTALDLALANDPSAPRGLLLEGPPGTGKTELVRRLENLRPDGMNIVKTSAPQLKASVVGGTEENVKKLFEEMAEDKLTLLFIDECDGVLPNRADSSLDQFDKAMTKAFLVHWGGAEGTKRVLVIGTTNRPEAIDPAILSRFGARVHVPPPDVGSRRGILEHQLRLLHAEWASDFASPELDRATQGLSGRDLERVAKRAVARAKADRRAVGAADLLYAATDVRKGHSVKVDSNATMANLAATPELRSELHTLIAMVRNFEHLQASGYSVPRGVLLEGPPGTGKTQIARVMANESGAAFVAPRASSSRGTLVSQAATNVREFFANARSQSPAILFLDEIDKLAPVGATGADAEFVSELLQEMDGVVEKPGTVIVVAATNYPDAVEPAVLSRFTRRVHVGAPDHEGRRLILETTLARKPLAPCAHEALQDLVTCTDGWVGRDLIDLVARAEMYALSDWAKDNNTEISGITAEHLRKAITTGS